MPIVIPFDILDLDVWLMKDRHGVFHAATESYPYFGLRHSRIEGIVRQCEWTLACHAQTEGSDLQPRVVASFLEPGIRAGGPQSTIARFGAHVGRLVVTDLLDPAGESVLPRIPDLR